MRTTSLNIPPVQSRQKSIRSFTVRAGRITQAQQNAYQLYWSSYGLDLEQGLIDQQAIFGNSNPLIMEIGFGMGESLFNMCTENPLNNFIGVEVHPPGVGKLLNNAGNAELSNLKIYQADAIDILKECIADNSIARMQVYFPDPWPKKKHHKRRLIKPEILTLIQQKLCPLGLLHIATDWRPYAEEVMSILETTEGLHNTSQGFSQRPKWRPQTKYESRGIKLGHDVCDILFEKLP